MLRKQKWHLWFIRVFWGFFSHFHTFPSLLKPAAICSRDEKQATHTFFFLPHFQTCYLFYFFLETRVIQDIWCSTLTRTDKRHVINIDMPATITFFFFFLNGRAANTTRVNLVTRWGADRSTAAAQDESQILQQSRRAIVFGTEPLLSTHRTAVLSGSEQELAWTLFALMFYVFLCFYITGLSGSFTILTMHLLSTLSHFISASFSDAQ